MAKEKTMSVTESVDLSDKPVPKVKDTVIGIGLDVDGVLVNDVVPRGGKWSKAEIEKLRQFRDRVLPLFIPPYQAPFKFYLITSRPFDDFKLTKRLQHLLGGPEKIELLHNMSRRVMSDQEAGDWKAQMINQHNIRLFVESSDVQADIISKKLTKMKMSGAIITMGMLVTISLQMLMTSIAEKYGQRNRSKKDPRKRK